MRGTKSILTIIKLACLAAGAAFTAAPALGEDDIVPQQEIEDTYRAQTQGRQLYRAKKYEEAIPYLEFAAQRGFKQAQHMLGEIYVNGLGGVKQDIGQGVGWLGVAAAGESEPRIKNLYEQVRANIPKKHNEDIDRIVASYIRNFDGRKTRVVCEMVQQAGTHGKALRCRYLDENLYPGISRS